MFEIQLKEVGGREKRREKRVESDRAGSALRPPRPFQPRGLSNKMNQPSNCCYYYCYYCYLFYFVFRVVEKKKRINRKRGNIDIKRRKILHRLV